MNDEAALPGRPDGEPLLLSTLASAAAYPNPDLFRQELPTAIRRAWDWREIDAAEVWQRLERLLGPDEVARFLEGQHAA